MNQVARCPYRSFYPSSSTVMTRLAPIVLMGNMCYMCGDLRISSGTLYSIKPGVDIVWYTAAIVCSYPYMRCSGDGSV